MNKIIPQLRIKQQPLPWQHALSEMITCPQILLEQLELLESDIAWQWDKNFPLRVTPSFVARMQKGDPHDPLLKQVLSLKEESRQTFNYSCDPLQEKKYNPVPAYCMGFRRFNPSRI